VLPGLAERPLRVEGLSKYQIGGQEKTYLEGKKLEFRVGRFQRKRGPEAEEKKTEEEIPGNTDRKNRLVASTGTQANG